MYAFQSIRSECFFLNVMCSVGSHIAKHTVDWALVTSTSTGFCCDIWVML